MGVRLLSLIRFFYLTMQRPVVRYILLGQLRRYWVVLFLPTLGRPAVRSTIPGHPHPIYVDAPLPVIMLRPEGLSTTTARILVYRAARLRLIQPNNPEAEWQISAQHLLF